MSNDINENAVMAISSTEMIRSSAIVEQFNQIATIMAAGRVTVPSHLQKSQSDCFAIVVQAAQWGMSPFSVAQKTHIVNGVLGYESQLVNAAIQASGAIKGRFHYEYKGDGANVSCRVGAIIKVEQEITWGEWLSASTVTTKNSPLWKTNPKQQLAYLQIKNWARLYCPGAILGVYSSDELEDIPSEKEINPPSQPTATTTEAPKETLDDLLVRIKTMSINDFKNVDPAPFTAEEKSTLRKAMTARRDEINSEKVVADIKAEPVNWEHSIKECGDTASLQQLILEMPDDIQLEYGTVIDEKFDSFR